MGGNRRGWEGMGWDWRGREGTGGDGTVVEWDGEGWGGQHGMRCEGIRFAYPDPPARTATQLS